MEVRINRIGRGFRSGTGSDIGGGGTPPPPSGGNITIIRQEQLSPILGGDVVEVVTATPHGLTPQDVFFTRQITIAGNSVGGYNATHSLINVKSANVFAIDEAWTSDGTGGTWVKA